MPACVGLGRLYADGSGVGKDETKAAQLFRQGCYVEKSDDDVGEGCYYLGQLYATGRGVRQSVDSAFFLNQRACGLEYKAACPQDRRL